MVAVFQALTNDPFFSETFTISVTGGMSFKPSLMNLVGRLSISHDLWPLNRFFLTSSLVNSLKQSNEGTLV